MLVHVQLELLLLHIKYVINLDYFINAHTHDKNRFGELNQRPCIQQVIRAHLSRNLIWIIPFAL